MAVGSGNSVRVGVDVGLGVLEGRRVGVRVGAGISVGESVTVADGVSGVGVEDGEIWELQAAKKA